MKRADSPRNNGSPPPNAPVRFTRGSKKLTEEEQADLQEVVGLKYHRVGNETRLNRSERRKFQRMMRKRGA